MGSLRILHVTPYYRDAWAYGGIPRVVAALADAQAARGHAVSVWTTDAGTIERLPHPDGAPWWRPWMRREPGGVSVHVFPNASNRLAYRHQGFLPLGFRRHAAVHAAAFDVAHLHACRNLPGGWAAGALERAGVPYVLAPNGTAPSLERYHAAKLAFDALLGRAVLDRASCLLAVSEAEHRQLRSLGVEAGRIRVIGNPVPAHEFSALPPKGTFRAAHRLGEGPLVVFLGKLTARKRVDVVLDAFAALDMPAATLAIAGNDMGAGAGARERAARLGLGARVRFTGLVEGAGRLEALADADVVVYPSEHEIFGLVPLEALLCGTPVVVAGDSGCGEVVAAVGGGLVVPVGDAAALAVAISRVLCHRAEWIAAAGLARDEVIRRFDAPVIAAALDETYGRVLH